MLPSINFPVDPLPDVSHILNKPFVYCSDLFNTNPDLLDTFCKLTFAEKPLNIIAYVDHETHKEGEEFSIVSLPVYERVPEGLHAKRKNDTSVEISCNFAWSCIENINGQDFLKIQRILNELMKDYTPPLDKFMHQAMTNFAVDSINMALKTYEQNIVYQGGRNFKDEMRFRLGLL